MDPRIDKQTGTVMAGVDWWSRMMAVEGLGFSVSLGDPTMQCNAVRSCSVIKGVFQALEIS